MSTICGNITAPGAVRDVSSAVRRAGTLLACVAVCAACAKAQALPIPEGPPLRVPDPPARVAMPLEPPLIMAAPEPEPAPAPPPRTPPRPAAPRAQPERTEVPPPASPAVEPADARALRAASPARDAEAERAVRDTLTRSARDLARVDYGRLSADARAQYEQAKRFAQQAEQALKDQNVVFAATLADKAATLATELLAGR